MNLQPKIEPGSPPEFGLTNHGNFKTMRIQDLVSVLRTAFRMEDFDRVEEILLSKDEKINLEIEQLQEKVEMEKLTRFHLEEELRKREKMCERGKRAQESYERLLKELKKSGLVDGNSITELRKKNGELECEVFELRKLKEKWVDDNNVIVELRKKNGELEYEVCKLKQKLVVDRRNAVAKLRSRVSELKNEKNTLASSLEVKKCELEEVVKRNLETINELRNENIKLRDEKREIEMLVESLNKKCEELHRPGGGNTELEPLAEAGPEVTTFEEKEDEEDVGDYEFGNDTMEASPLQRNEHTPHSLVGVVGIGTTQLPSKGNKDAQGPSSVMGRLELEEDIGIMDLDDDDGCTSQILDRKKAISGNIKKNEHPSSSINVENIPLNSALFDGSRKTNKPLIWKVYSKRVRKM